MSARKGFPRDRGLRRRRINANDIRFPPEPERASPVIGDYDQLTAYDDNTVKNGIARKGFPRDRGLRPLMAYRYEAHRHLSPERASPVIGDYDLLMGNCLPMDIHICPKGLPP